MKSVIVIDRGLRDEAGTLAAGGGWVVERRLTERRRGGAQGGRRRQERRVVEAPFVLRRDGALIVRYTCPRDGQIHESPWMPEFADRYAQALAGEGCLCPTREGWLVRHGVIGRSVTVWALALLWVLNLCDILLTRQALHSGVAREANRLMSSLITLGWAPALAFKIGVVSLGVVLLWRYRGSRLAQSASVALAGFYALVVLYQVVFVTLTR